jgi:HAD superfamily hydrolase (TIGR01509 family)
MTPTFKLSAVIFDMDGLMLDTERISIRAWDLAMAERGYSIPPETYLQVLGRNIQGTRSVFCQALGDELPFDEIYRRKQYFVDEIIAQDGIALKPGLLELLDTLTQKSLPKAVGSSTARPTVWKKLTLTGIANRFDVIVCGDEVQHGKPAPDIFLAAAAQLAVAPAGCLVLEDSENGIQAAHAAGMIPVMIPDLKQPAEEIRQIAYRVFPSLHRVDELVRDLG